MKINKGHENYNNYIKQAQKIETPKVEAKTSKEKNIDVQISESTKRLAQFVNLEKDEAISERVETIKKAIIEGSYKVDEKTIAKKSWTIFLFKRVEKLNEQREFVKHLESILKLLKKEQKVLEKNDGDALLEIIENKNTYIEGLEKFKGIDLDDEKIMDLIGEIDSLQELNLLLTRQALSFQENFLASLKKAAKPQIHIPILGTMRKTAAQI